jgi:hypothetical protein
MDNYYIRHFLAEQTKNFSYGEIRILGTVKLLNTDGSNKATIKTAKAEKNGIQKRHMAFDSSFQYRWKCSPECRIHCVQGPNSLLTVGYCKVAFKVGLKYETTLYRQCAFYLLENLCDPKASSFLICQSH